MIIRNDDETFPEDHPVAVTVYDPRNRKRLERTLREGRDGFYHLPFETAPEDPTGGWRIEVGAISSWGGKKMGGDGRRFISEQLSTGSF